jgi:hypothetical protein
MQENDDLGLPSHSKDNKTLKLKPPKQKHELKKKTYSCMPFGKFAGRSIWELVQEERWYIDYMLSINISSDLKDSIKSYL